MTGDRHRASTTRAGSPDTPTVAAGTACAPCVAWSCLALLLAPLGQVHLLFTVAGAAAGLVAVVLARRRGASHVVLRLVTLAVGLAVLITFQVPVTVWVVVAGMAVAGRRWDWVRPAGGWVPAGNVDRLTLVAGGVVVVGAGLALTAWARWTETFGESTLQVVELVRDAPLWLLVPLGVVFMVVNAVAEEVAYRRVVQDALEAVWGPAVAVVVQAVAFGVLHVAGFPAGTVGMALAFGYGLVLGALRLRTGGLRVAIAVHVGADATIAVLVWLLVVPATA